MVLVADLALEVLGFLIQAVFEIFGTLIWGLFEAILSKSDVVVGFFVMSLVIAVILFCWMKNPVHATIWSLVEICVMIILGFVVDASGS